MTAENSTGHVHNCYIFFNGKCFINFILWHTVKCHICFCLQLWISFHFRYLVNYIFILCLRLENSHCFCLVYLTSFVIFGTCLLRSLSYLGLSGLSVTFRRPTPFSVNINIFLPRFCNYFCSLYNFLTFYLFIFLS